RVLARGPAPRSPSQRLGPTAAALLAAALFAAHPAQVETVAWVTTMKDLLAALFALCAVGVALDAPFGLRALRGRTSLELDVQISGRWALATAFFLCSLLSKPQLAALPLILAALHAYEGRRPREFAPGIAAWLALAAPVLLV